MAYYRSLSITDKDFDRKLVEMYKEDGLAVITDVFSEAECQASVDEILEYFEKLGTGIDRNRLKETWTNYNLPPQTRAGLFQALVSNIPAVWNLRSRSFSSVRKTTSSTLAPTGVLLEGAAKRPMGNSPVSIS